MNKWILQNMHSVFPYKNLIGIILLVSWLIIGFISSKFKKSRLRSTIIINLPAFLMFLLLIYQEVINGQYWSNLIGDVTQLYFIPLFNISSSIAGLLMIFTPWPITVWLSSLIAFSLMFAAYYLGSYLRSAYDIHVR